ncbi:AraC family transcriptional regulator [Saccharomonospora saliphila]|uniref:AraC family transcriptional regulator n=1 Tax=Saccharomonospora saliphila TaxID=369829 RepID=UPI00036C6665|nr:AraC family transcriptional regulator [Saccharomonospora saliphila]
MLDWDFPRGVASVALLVRFATERGVGVSAALSGTGLDLDTIADPLAQVEAHQELAVVRNVVAACGEDPAALGARVGRRYHATAYGIWGFAVTSSPTVGAALRLALHYIELTYVFCVPRLCVHEDSAGLRFHAEAVPGDVRPFLLARDVAAGHTLMAELLGVRPAPEADGAGIAFARELLDRPMPQANEHTAALCERQCRDLLARRRDRDGVARRVRELLRGPGGLGAGMDEIAAELSMTVRTLRRRLAAEGTSFRALVDELRRARAEELLAGRALSVEQIAHRLGYAESSSFVRAFTRWTGVPPGRFRPA